MNRKEAFELGYKAGVKQACATAGISDDEFLMSKVAHAVVSTDHDAQVTLCKVAKLIFETAGEVGEEWAIYDTIEKAGSAVHPVVYDTYINPVLTALAEAPVVSELEKAAAGGALVPKAVTSSLSFGSDAYKALLAASAMLGTAGGGALWALNRGPNEDDVETQLKRDQADYYRRMAKDIKRKIKLKEAANPKIEETRKAIEDSSYLL